MSFIKYIADENHYKEVLSLVAKAKRTVWVGTADIKDLYVGDKPFLAMLAGLLKKGVEVRLIHAKEPGTAWREDHEKHPILYEGMERVLCPRVHFKLIIIDSSIAYIGSANLTGAGMGMKSPRKRNFEAGILPLDHYPITGVIWYQGESTAERVEVHEELFPLLVDSWRNYFAQDGRSGSAMTTTVIPG